MTFTRSYTLKHHMRVNHSNDKLVLLTLSRVTKSDDTSARYQLQLSSAKKALGIFSEYTFLSNKDRCNDLLICFDDYRNDIIRLVEKCDLFIITHICMSRTANDGSELFGSPHFSSKMVIEIKIGINLNHIDEAIAIITNSLEKFHQMRSGGE